MKKSTLLITAGLIAVGVISFIVSNNNNAQSTNNDPSVSDSVTIEETAVLQTESASSAVHSVSPYEIIYQHNDKRFRINPKETGVYHPFLLPNESELELIEMEKRFTTSVIPKEVLDALPLSKDMLFYMGLQSNLDPNLWVYTERKDEDTLFNVRLYNLSTKESKILFNQASSPNQKYGFKPLIFSPDNKRVYFEAFVFDSYLNNEELWELDLNTLAFREINIHSFYTSSPKMSPDGKFFAYSAASQPNNVHVSPNQLLLFNIETEEESRIIADENGFIGLIGWSEAKQ